jgi:hypothetical protein
MPYAIALRSRGVFAAERDSRELAAAISASLPADVSIPATFRQSLQHF